MAFRPNYRVKRNERNLAKQQKKEEKVRRREDRKSERDLATEQEPDVVPPPDI